MAFLIQDRVSGKKVVIFGDLDQLNLLSSLSPEPIEVLQFSEFIDREKPSSDNPFELVY